MILCPASDNAPFLQPVTANRFPTYVLKLSHVDVCLVMRHCHLYIMQVLSADVKLIMSVLYNCQAIQDCLIQDPLVFAIVEFKKNTDIAIVPVCWLNEEETICFWPQTSNVSKFVRSLKKNGLYVGNLQSESLGQSRYVLKVKICGSGRLQCGNRQ